MSSSRKPLRGKQARPTKEAIKNYWRLLSDAADQGDVTAAAKLIELDHLERLKGESLGRIVTHG